MMFKGAAPVEEKERTSSHGINLKYDNNTASSKEAEYKDNTTATDSKCRKKTN